MTQITGGGNNYSIEKWQHHFIFGILLKSIDFSNLLHYASIMTVQKWEKAPFLLQVCICGTQEIFKISLYHFRF